MIELLNGNALHIPLADKSVQCVITSPPFFGLRDYGTSKWMGGGPGCDHKKPGATKVFGNPEFNKNRPSREATDTVGYRDTCGKCGAVRIDSQIGLEKSPAEYIEKLVAVFQEVWRVLRDDGTLWLNLGDSYNGSGKGRGKGGVGPKSRKQLTNRGSRFENEQPINHSGFKPKDLFGIPWRVAFALQEQGWYLRSDIVWAKENCMPESVTDRPTRSHEYIFLLSKQARYFYDMVAVSEPLKADSIRRNQSDWNGNEERDYINGPQNHMSRYLGGESAKSATTRNSRSVWTIPTRPYPGSHFATFPEKLVEPMVLAGTSPQACEHCGAPWKRRLEKKANGKVHPANDISGVGQGYDSVDGKEQNRGKWQEGVYYETVDWQPTCDCEGKYLTCMVCNGILSSNPGYHGEDDETRRRTAMGAPPCNGKDIGAETHDERTGSSYQSSAKRQSPTESTISGNRCAPRRNTMSILQSKIPDSVICPHCGYVGKPNVSRNTGSGHCVVLDPFSGTGTVGRVCIKHKRSFVGLELKPEYIELARERTSNAPVMLMENI